MIGDTLKGAIDSNPDAILYAYYLSGYSAGWSGWSADLHVLCSGDRRGRQSTSRGKPHNHDQL